MRGSTWLPVCVPAAPRRPRRQPAFILTDLERNALGKLLESVPTEQRDDPAVVAAMLAHHESVVRFQRRQAARSISPQTV
jgi:hypothetical protein